MVESALFNNSTVYLGIDLGGSFSFVDIINKSGKVIEEIRISFPPAIPIHGSLPQAKKGVWSSGKPRFGA